MRDRGEKTEMDLKKRVKCQTSAVVNCCTVYSNLLVLLKGTTVDARRKGSSCQTHLCS